MVTLRLVAASLLGCLLSGPVPARAVPVPEPVPAPTIEHVLAISVDALNPEALTRLGAARAPNLHRLLAEGASTLNARSQVESTETLPNHTSMVTGRRVAASRDGHGVTWNSHRPGATVQTCRGPRRLVGVHGGAHGRVHGPLRREAEVLDLRALVGRRHRPAGDPRGRRPGPDEGRAGRPGPDRAHVHVRALRPRRRRRTREGLHVAGVPRCRPSGRRPRRQPAAGDRDPSGPRRPRPSSSPPTTAAADRTTTTTPRRTPTSGCRSRSGDPASPTATSTP